MCNLKQALHTQQKITDAVKRITDYFTGEVLKPFIELAEEKGGEA